MAANFARYNKIRDRLDTGDVVLFTGRGLTSRLIRLGTGEYSHVGMVVRAVQEDLVLLFESTTLSDVDDIVTGEPVRGCMLVPLSYRVGRYRGRIAIRRLIGVDRDHGFRERVREVRKTIHLTPYEEKWTTLIRAALPDEMTNTVEEVESLFCSEAVALFYQETGLIPKKRTASAFHPGDFTSKSGVIDQLLTKSTAYPQAKLLHEVLVNT